MDHAATLVDHVLQLLRGRGARVGHQTALKGWPVALRGERPEGAEHSAWQLLEHLRLAQWDILEYSRRPDHVSPDWPAGYWPAAAVPPDDEAWQSSIAAFQADLEAMQGLVAERAETLMEPLPHGQEGHTLLREALLVADHNAYHVGQLVALRRRLGAWPPPKSRATP